MIRVWLNNEEIQLESPVALDQALNEWQPEPAAFAIAINQAFVPRSSYQDILLQDGDRVELLSPMQGG